MKKDLLKEINKDNPKFALYKEIVSYDRVSIKTEFVKYIYHCDTLNHAYIKGKHWARKDCNGSFGQIHYDNNFPYAITFENVNFVCYVVKEI